MTIVKAVCAPLSSARLKGAHPVATALTALAGSAQVFYARRITIFIAKNMMTARAIFATPTNASPAITQRRALKRMAREVTVAIWTPAAVTGLMAPIAASN
jgi:hypothetical protein